MDFGAKNNIVRSLQQRGCQVTVYPADTSAEEIIKSNPDGIMLSNGPGDPSDCVSIIREVGKLYETDIPIFAICLGHQLMALARGGKTYKLKYGHRGGNHPVKDLSTGRVTFLLRTTGTRWMLPPWIRLWPRRHLSMSTTGPTRDCPMWGNGSSPFSSTRRACPGPQDSGYLFDRFMDMMKGV